ncbi:MAG: zinc-binding dehydrogenase [Ardenticatenaceae bacterium]|nr:zinc-binding dehydrogenase [Anaerolineales bacterium]MCB8921885.1 zinc-binding dehydrogenase [Ardenticatenaceae bacterium]MCB8992207.1 zinc-binding dehydrogenase [Ardenticatenaceae bacterium]
MNQLPETMTAVILESYSGVTALHVEQRPLPKPGPHEVLVKVAASSINPSDLSFIEGMYGFRKPTPVVPGFEGAGTVVAGGASSGLMGRYLMGKRVACISQSEGDGVWAEYVATAVNYALPLDDSVSLEQGAMSVVNPLTAVALIEIAQNAGHKTIVNTAAAGALGQMINRLGQSAGIRVINIVRRDTQVELLQQRGADIVLNSSSPDFAQQLHDACHQHRARLAFDAIAGPMTLQLLEAMPIHGKVTVYGGLSLQPSMVSPAHTIFQSKSVDGFWLSKWLAKKNPLQSLLIWRRTQKLITTTLQSEIRARYSLQDAPKAVLAYQEQMTGGKVLIVPA